MRIEVDFLVIGSGLAGLNACLRLAESGSRVMMVTKRKVGESNTAYAQGGIASVMASDDSIEHHAKDTINAGAGLCDPNAVNSIVEAGPAAIERLVSLGVEFDRQDTSSYDLTREGGHSRRRILHTKDVTGREIDRALRRRVQETSNIEVLPHHIVIDLITQTPSQPGPRQCIGAYILNSETGEVDTIAAKATLLATGGAGKAYLYTSNPDVSTGDGVAMAYRAGATIANMEFFQFHPTCLNHPPAKSFLIRDALRGAGGNLRLRNGHPFMKDVHPMADLAPRDIVARAIDREMKRTGDDFVHLDMTAHDPAYIARRFPNIHTACLSLNIAMTKVPIPVVPAAHYMCGGVRTDVNGTTDVPGLWVSGETGCTGLHGANRLASNSLLEAAVVSERAALEMIQFAQQSSHAREVREWDSGDSANPDEMVVVSHNWDEIRRTMWNYVGIVRSDKRLERAAARVSKLKDEIHDYYSNIRVTHDLIELRNLCDVAHLIIACAQHRRESRGLHHTIDCPDTNPLWNRQTVGKRGGRRTVNWES